MVSSPDKNTTKIIMEIKKMGKNIKAGFAVKLVFEKLI